MSHPGVSSFPAMGAHGEVGSVPAIPGRRCNSSVNTNLVAGRGMLAREGMGLEARDSAGCLNHTGFVSVISHSDMWLESTDSDVYHPPPGSLLAANPTSSCCTR